MVDILAVSKKIVAIIKIGSIEAALCAASIFGILVASAIKYAKLILVASAINVNATICKY
ncbi:MAG: hypothetical protein DCE90_13835 [Pseudanabaena sp.]|nr:MAG: hypothetical protein DCE90_13835 [Pseudanabaena sp.]